MKLLRVCLKMPKCSFRTWLFGMDSSNMFGTSTMKKCASCFRNGQHHQHPLSVTDPRSILIYMLFFNTQTTNADYSWICFWKLGFTQNREGFQITTGPQDLLLVMSLLLSSGRSGWFFFTCSHVFFITIFQPFQPQMHFLIQSARWAVAVASRKTGWFVDGLFHLPLGWLEIC